MDSWKKWGAIVALLVAIALPACVDDPWNEGEPRTDGGTLTQERCEMPRGGEPFCHRDGDNAYWTCENSAWPEKVLCETGYCWGARDTIAAMCIPQENILDTEEGVEPGSDLWNNRFNVNSGGGSGGGGSTGGSGSSCRKVCTSSKACGDSCISKSKTCNVGRGCACNG